MRSLVLLSLLALTACRANTDDTTTEDVDGDGVPASEDCNDTDATAYPGAAEVCDGVDNDCDDAIDDNATDASLFYADGDADGVGGDETTTACDAPEGHVAEGGDCDDADPAVHPGAAETDCEDPKDYNCDGSSGFADADADGFAACADCDDTAAAINPDATEACDGIDNDCDAEIDEAGASGESTFYADTDGDGHGDAAAGVSACAAPTGHVESSDDCDDAKADVYPGAAETCDDVDQDCDGETDEGATDAGTFYADADADGHGDASAPVTACEAPTGTVASSDDCDDADPSAYTGATEVCDGKDNACAGTLPSDEADGDGDGVKGCDGDCDDAKAAVKPGAAEVCNDVDDNCDGVTDDDATDRRTFYADGDGDGYGSKTAKLACDEPDGHVETDDDCDDDAAAVHPGAAETCDAVDEDCDGAVDEDLLGSGAACAAASCQDLADAGDPDGVYFVDPDGSGDAFEAFCDMAGTDGWTLLLAANKDSTFWGNNSAEWKAAGTSGAVPDAWQDADHRSLAYSELDTDEIRLCYQDASKCYTFDHGKGVPLQKFFTDDLTHVVYSLGMFGYTNSGDPAEMNAFYTALGVTGHSVTCHWLGINDTRSISAIGILGDWNGGCAGLGGTYLYADDLAIGVGLQSCYDANGCERGGSGNKAGQTRGFGGVDNSGTQGPWFVFGR